ncbi:MAG: hypothetical protein ACE5HF_05310 [Gemmatimonadota bacterium]
MRMKARLALFGASTLVLVLATPFALRAQGDSTTSAVADAPGSIDGTWRGGLEVLGQGLEITIRIRTAEDGLSGTIDIPAQNAADIPLETVSYAAPKVHFELMGSPGLAVFDGVAHGDSIHGDFTQATVAGTFTLGREASPEGGEDGPDQAGDGDAGPGR